ncbi:unnamed protein product [Cochlearia groenlandica]
MNKAPGLKAGFLRLSSSLTLTEEKRRQLEKNNGGGGSRLNGEAINRIEQTKTASETREYPVPVLLPHQRTKDKESPRQNKGEGTVVGRRQVGWSFFRYREMDSTLQI